MATHLSKSQLESVKSDLILEKQRLLKSEVDLVHIGENRIDKKVDLPANPDEANDAADIETEFAKESHLLESVAVIDIALQRIDSGGYGICKDCAEEIPLERLQAFPAATRCLACKQAFEAKH